MVENNVLENKTTLPVILIPTYILAESVHHYMLEKILLK